MRYIFCGSCILGVLLFGCSCYLFAILIGAMAKILSFWTVTTVISAFIFSTISTESNAKVKCAQQNENNSNSAQMPVDLQTRPSRVGSDRVFSAIWSLPTFECSQRFGVDLPLGDFNIEANAGENTTGEVITLLGQHWFGLLPYFDKVTKEPVNGGLPQLGNLSLHLEKAAEDVLTWIPDPGFSGAGVIDFENWSPKWEQPTFEIYHKKSIQLVKARHPEWDPAQVELVARLEFEQAGKAYLESTLRLVKEMRPHANWGYYHYPYCHNIDTPGGQCDPVYARTNSELMWLFDSVTAIHPSIYLHGYEEYPLPFVKGCMGEAFRVRGLSNDEYKPVIAYTRFNYSHSGLYYTKEDLNHTILQAAEMGADGVIFWGDHNDTSSAQSCIELWSYLNTTLGPLVKEVTSAASNCSESFCSGNGRCVGNIFQCSNRDIMKDSKQTCTCSCFRGWTGEFCSKKLNRK